MIRDFVSLFFPKVCLTCSGPLERGSDQLCVNCVGDLPKTGNHIIEIPEFDQRFSGVIKYESILVYLLFQKKGVVQKILHELKYNDRPEIGQLLGRWYGVELKESGFEFDLIIPIPLHPSKLKKRGYNQSEFFASGIAQVMETRLLPEGLVRTKATTTQTKKSRLERWDNVSGLFECSDASLIKGNRILLVDDVLTTGSTLIAAGEPLWKAGISSLSFGVIAAAK